MVRLFLVDAEHKVHNVFIIVCLILGFVVLVMFFIVLGL
jgi:hypothetical protein